ncbi:hypothetical protein PIB30_083668 [Stylosanthes scabra]|uniref:Uncharacterized protein n=1 Tax=Stylosanthes scabra TaxID=79078 RepID=A0ABU6ST21_9FABA|nr:hypothetical protein [Stylosanthes scabra]
MPYELYCLLDLGPLRSTKDIFITADMGIVSIPGIAEDVVVRIGSLTVPADFHVIRSTRHSKGDCWIQARLHHQRVFIQSRKCKGCLPPKETTCCEQKSAHQIQLKKKDKDERRESEEAKSRLKKLKGLRSSPPHVKKKTERPCKE